MRNPLPANRGKINAHRFQHVAARVTDYAAGRHIGRQPHYQECHAGLEITASHADERAEAAGSHERHADAEKEPPHERPGPMKLVAEIKGLIDPGDAGDMHYLNGEHRHRNCQGPGFQPAQIAGEDHILHRPEGAEPRLPGDPAGDHAEREAAQSDKMNAGQIRHDSWPSTRRYQTSGSMPFALSLAKRPWRKRWKFSVL